VPTHFCTSLFIVGIDEKISEYELVCTRIDRWTERDGPPRNIGKMKDCGHSELYDNQLDEHLVNSGAENMLEFVQIKLALDLEKMLKHFDSTHLIEGGKHKSNLFFNYFNIMRNVWVNKNIKCWEKKHKMFGETKT